MTSLSEKSADALCTIIVLGYSATLKSVRFEYDKDEEIELYNKIRTKFAKLKVTITIGKSEEKIGFPLIVGKTGSVAMYDDPNHKQAKLELSEVHNFAKSLEQQVDKDKSPEPKKISFYGAYVGGFASISTVDIIGASDLSLYKGKYRTLKDDDTSVQKSYEGAKKISNAVIKAINEYFNRGPVKEGGLKIRNQYMNEEVKEDYKKGHLFKSYHGMVKAMTNFMHIFKRTENFFFEIALTKDTSKVSSCFPCATFMQANNNPPTSIHLGRGDNWSIPDGADYLKKPWEKCIIDWYKKGMEILGNKSSTSQGIIEWKNFVKENSIIDEVIPTVFLESLTFEKKFTDRINGTLPDG
jgi:hypothetical protein